MFVLCQPHSTMKGRFTGGFLKRFSELEVNNKVTGAGKLYWSSDHRDLITVCKTESVSFCLLPVCARLPTPWLWWLRFWYAGHIKWIWLWAGVTRPYYLTFSEGNFHFALKTHDCSSGTPVSSFYFCWGDHFMLNLHQIGSCSSCLSDYDSDLGFKNYLSKANRSGELGLDFNAICGGINFSISFLFMQIIAWIIWVWSSNWIFSALLALQLRSES